MRPSAATQHRMIASSAFLRRDRTVYVQSSTAASTQAQHSSRSTEASVLGRLEEIKPGDLDLTGRVPDGKCLVPVDASRHGFAHINNALLFGTIAAGPIAPARIGFTWCVVRATGVLLRQHGACLTSAAKTRHITAIPAGVLDIQSLRRVKVSTTIIIIA